MVGKETGQAQRRERAVGEGRKKVPEKRHRKSRGAEDEAVRGAANSYGKNRLKNS